MAWQVVGTREKWYRVDTLSEVSAWIDDEIATINAGWLPLASERAPDGSLRVLYGGLRPELSDRKPAGAGEADTPRDPILHTPTDAGKGAVMLAILTLALVLATFAMFLRP